MSQPTIRVPAKIRGFRSSVINDIIDYVQMITPLDTPTTRHEFRPSGVVAIDRGPYQINDYRDYCLGCWISGTVVNVNAGWIHHGVREPVAVAADTVTLTEDHQYVWVEYTFAGSASIAGPSTVMPVSEEKTYRCWLAQFRLRDARAYVEQIGHVGNIEIPGAFA